MGKSRCWVKTHIWGTNATSCHTRFCGSSSEFCLKSHMLHARSQEKKPPRFILKIPNCGNVGSEPPLDSCGSAQLFPWQFSSGKLTPHMNVTTAPTLSSGIHLPVTASIYVRSPSRSLRPSDRPPLKPPTPASQLFISPR